MRGWCLLVLLAGCGSSATDPGTVFDACAPTTIAAPGASADQLASIDAAIAMWGSRGITGLVRIADAGDLALEFKDANPAMYGFYDDTAAIVYINTVVTDPSRRTITIAHELGHAFGLVHIAPDTRASVMNPGNLVITPNDSDATSVAARWGACGGTSNAR